MEEDEADDQRGSAVLEKGASEKGKEEDDEEEEGGITFKVRSSSTPDERRDRKHAVSPLPVPPITPNTLTAPKGDMSSHSPVTCPEKSSQSSQPIPGACATMVQPQSQICTSTSTATSSSGIYFLNPSLDMQNSTRTVYFKVSLFAVQSTIRASARVQPSPLILSQPAESYTPVTSHRSL